MRLSVIGIMLTLALAILVAPLTTEAQPPRKGYRIGLLGAGKPGITEEVFRAYGEAQNLAIEYRYAEGKPERLPELAAELVRLNVDVLVANGPEAVLRAARDATQTIPIVMIAVDYDPIALG